MFCGAVFLSTGVGTFEVGMGDLLACCASFVYYRRIDFYISFIVVWGVDFDGSGLFVVVYCVRYFI